MQTSCDEAAYKASTGLTTDVMFATGTVNPVTISEDDVWRIAYRNIRRVNVFFKYADGLCNAIKTLWWCGFNW